MSIVDDEVHISYTVEDELELSPLARDLQTLKQATFRVVKERGKLPHTLFWSLFHNQISEIKKRKGRNILLRKLFLE